MSCKRPRAASVPVCALIAGLLLVLLLAGCSPEVTPTVTPSAGHGPDTTRTSVTVENTAPPNVSPQPITSRWPPGVDTVILSIETGIYVVDAQGVRWSQQNEAADQPSTTVTLRGPQIVSGLDGIAVSSNKEFLAYVEGGKEIVVRSIADGGTVQRAAVTSNGHTTLRSISPDGILAALVSVDPELQAEKLGDGVPWTVTVVDLSSGTAVVEDTLADFVRRRIEGDESCGLVSLTWLPECKLLVGMSGDPYETYLYDPIADRLVLVPELEYVWSSTPEGLVLGTRAAQPGEAVVWNGSDGALEPVILDSEWPYGGHGALNADGTALVLTVAKSPEWAEYGWQVFRRTDSEWRPDGPVAEVDWMHQPPTLLSSDGNRAWSVVYQSTADNETVLLSHDFATGAWEEWLQSGDMQVGGGSFNFVGIALED